MKVDCVRELLAYHKLDGLTPTSGRHSPGRPDWGPDPRLEQLRKAVRLVREADGLRRCGKNRAAVERCNEALSSAENYGGALLERSKVYLYYLGNHWRELSADDRRRYADWAWSDSFRCNDLYPGWNTAYLIHFQNIIYGGYVNSDSRYYRYVIKMMNWMLGNHWLGQPPSKKERSFVLNLRAQCHHFLGETRQAEKDYGESIRSCPISRAGTSTALNSGTSKDGLSWQEQTE